MAQLLTHVKALVIILRKYNFARPCLTLNQSVGQKRLGAAAVGSPEKMIIKRHLVVRDIFIWVFLGFRHRGRNVFTKT